MLITICQSLLNLVTVNLSSMIVFSTRILKFNRKGEKTGWSYIEVTRKRAEQLSHKSRVSFRVRGRLDNYPIEKRALIPMGEGNFILPINSMMRKATGKVAGDTIRVEFELDPRPLTPSSDFIKCLKDDPRAFEHFKTLPKSHQNYFSKWIDEAKTIHTKTRRITMAVIALGQSQGFLETVRAYKGAR